MIKNFSILNQIKNRIYDQNYTLICPDYANQTNAQANKMKGLLYATEDY